MRMRKRAVYLLVVICIILTGCFNSQRTSSSKSTVVKAPKPITLNVAKKLIGENNLKEITTKEIWQRMHVQVFSGFNGTAGSSYLIKENKVIKLCSAYAHYGINSMVVSDLNQDKQPELIYSYSRGSGMRVSQIQAYTQGKLIGILTSAYESQYFFKKRDDQNIEVITGTQDNWVKNDSFPYPSSNQIEGGISIGKIISRDSNESLSFKVTFNKDVPKYIIDSIWYGR